MPTLISESEIKIEWTDILGRLRKVKPKGADERSAGVHLSGVIRYALTEAGLLTPDEASDEMPLRMAVGMAWEEWAVGLWPELRWQPGERELDGVFGSPDGLSAGGALAETDCLEEFKATWKSRYNHGDVLKERIWLWQLSGYCKMMGLQYARLHVLWVNGDYRPPSPEYRTYVVGFSQAELDKFWSNVVLANKEFAKPEEGQ